MPTSRSIPTRVPLTKLLGDEHAKFAIPDGQHLLIVTPRHVFAWDTRGIRSVFQSSRSGVVAAKEATDGSGILAVASKDVVVLHDTKRGKEQSWGLNAPEEEIRHLEYSNDAKSLYLSTTSDGTIQQYSLEHSRLLQPIQKHTSAPVALAISSTGHLMLSTSSDPPAVYLKNLAHNTAATLIQPAASTSPVCAAAFHPERPDICMLAFKDATIAAYDATRINKAGRYAAQVVGSDGEISRIQKLHRRTFAGDLTLDITNAAPPIVAAAFLPSHKLRAVTAGRDGRCRIIDFAKGGTILRTWHCKAPCTTLSVLKAESTPRLVSNHTSSSTTQRQEAGLLPNRGLIAVGLIDGRVQVYDTVGILLVEQRITSPEEKILSVQWVNGPSPCAPVTTKDGQTIHDFKLLESSGPAFSAAWEAALKPHTAQSMQRSKKSSGIGLPTSLKPLEAQSPQLPRQLTFHPDEMSASIFRQTSKSKRTSTLPSYRYHDLFSPIKSAAPRSSSHRQVSRPHRNRPQLSSQTFMRSPAMEVKLNKQRLVLSASSSASNSSTSKSASKSQLAKSSMSLKLVHQASDQAPPYHSQGRQVSFKHSAMNLGDATVVSGRRTHASMVNIAASRHLAEVIAARSKVKTKASPRTLSEMELLDTSDEDVNIWLTSEDDGISDQRPRPYKKKAGTPIQSHAAHERQKPVPLHIADSLPIDGSAAQEVAMPQFRASPSDVLASVSEDIRELFPRSSSLSPHNVTRVEQKKKGHISPQTQSKYMQPLADIEVNAANGRQPKSPWARARASKGAKVKSVRKNDFVTVLQNGDGSVDDAPLPNLTRSTSFACLTCPETKARLQAMEGEVAHLKGEVLALKAVLRRNGVDVKGLLR
ncbi:Putative WD40/YVTN repeat-like-containing domain superfamily [Septoria linicola]|uniref:WD40/YVTN repeat-like-containing domain superfamily n=1 Tax=Septoria linicola TaxID=215465 RepID=A0A9Q9EG95_9PEZI|nr:putative WD40/YVTN repeat-like-containing domain superfamily [Septoria linicola]USW48542.1 Putative WD40/YVTN repeat-like-containing domain superfamily [Septoria linicola]